MKTTSHKLSNGLFLVVTRPEGKPTAPVPAPIDHILCVDVSYSMATELALLREHIKMKLVKLVRAGDTFSMVWFSGRGQHGTVFEGEPISTLPDLQAVKDAVDRLIKPVGMTGFKEPLEDVRKLRASLQKKRPEAMTNLIFMSDGCDNQWSLAENLEALQGLTGIEGATFVEYGYYADRKTLTKMAEKLGGSVVFAEDFPGYMPVVERAVQGVPGRSMLVMGVPGAIDDFAFGASEDVLRAFQVETDKTPKIRVPCDLGTDEVLFDLAYLSKTAQGKVGPSIQDLGRTGDHASLGLVYAAMSAYAHRMRGEVVRVIGLDLGDVEFCERFATCFGKQRFSDFAEGALDAACHWERRFVRGYNGAFKPEAASLTVLDFFEIMSDVGATAMIEHALFKYDRITRKSVDVSDEGLRFQQSTKEGCAITSIVLNENRPNISFKLKKKGIVRIDHIPGKPASLPDAIETFVWRNYAVVADAIVHIDLFPTRLTYEAMDMLREHPRYDELPFHGLSDDGDAMTAMFDLRKLGLTTLQDTAAPLYERLAIEEVDLCKARVAQKVYKFFQEEASKSVGGGGVGVPGLEMAYGAEGARWLVERGFGINGFSPKKKLEEPKDVYKGIELQTKIASFSSLPSVAEPIERLKSGKKLTPAMEAMRPDIELCQKKQAEMTPQLFAKWVGGMSEGAISEARYCLMKVARTKFAVVVGQTWFVDAPTPGEASASITRDGIEYKLTSKLVEIDVEV